MGVDSTTEESKDKHVKWAVGVCCRLVKTLMCVNAELKKLSKKNADSIIGEHFIMNAVISTKGLNSMQFGFQHRNAMILMFVLIVQENKWHADTTTVETRNASANKDNGQHMVLVQILTSALWGLNKTNKMPAVLTNGELSIIFAMIFKQEMLFMQNMLRHDAMIRISVLTKQHFQNHAESAMLDNVS